MIIYELIPASVYVVSLSSPSLTVQTDMTALHGGEVNHHSKKITVNINYLKWVLTSKSLKLSMDGQSTAESMSPREVLIRMTIPSVSMPHRLFRRSKTITDV